MKMVYQTALTFIIFIVLALYSAFAYEESQDDFTSAFSEDIDDTGIVTKNKSISLDLKGIDIVELFRILSLKMGLTIVPAKSVSGRVNIFLNNLTFQDALDVVLISQDLACDKKDNIINIMTAAEYEKLYGEKYNEKRKVKMIKLYYAKPSAVFDALSQVKSEIGKVIADEATGTILLIDIPEKLALMENAIKELDQSLETEVFDLKYAKSADMKTHLSSAITAGSGELFVDDRSSKMVISDLPGKMKRIKRMVKAFDEESQQVFIEAEIIQVTLKDEYQQGINWEKIFKEMSLADLDLKGTFGVNPSFTPSPALTTSYLQMQVGVLGSNDYTATLQLLRSFGDTKILSRPRIAAINNQEAKIMVGSREAYVTQTLSQAETTTVTSENIEFIDVGVKLNVVPTINKDNFITMKIKPEVSSVRETLTTSLGSVVPILETSEAETVVKVKDGTMIMIAGLMKEEKRKDNVGIPGLSRMPLLGAFFGSRSKQNETTEMIVFITPHIISGEAVVAGTEPEKIIPADIIPDEMADSIISKNIESIRIKPQSKEETPEVNPDIARKMKKMKDIKER